MAVCKSVLIVQELSKEAWIAVSSCQDLVFLISCDLIQPGPYLQHAAFLSAVNGMGITFLHGVRPAQIPVRQLAYNGQCLFISCILVSVHKSHNRLVHNVLRGPDILPCCQLFKIFFRNRSYPFSSVQFLASCQFGNDLIQLYF